MNFLFNGVSLQNGRNSNMDSLILKRRLIDKKNTLLAVICDGVGGLTDGAYASVKTVQMLNEWFNNARTVDRIGIRMRDTVLSINASIIAQKKQKNIDTATTMSALLLVENDYYIVHVGDSRIYCYENDTLIALTNDDVSETGKLTVYIGKAEDIFPQYYEGTTISKVFFMCSDGLYRQMDMDFLRGRLKILNELTINEAMNVLPQFVISRGELDNISLAIVKTES